MFKRVRKELAKQQIEENEFDANDTEEKLAGVFSDTDNDSDDSDDEQTRRLKKKARHALIQAINSQPAADSEDEDDDEDSEGDDSEEGDSEEGDGEEDASDNEEEEEEGFESYVCNVCPDKELKNEQQVEVHLKSKLHRRRERFLKKQNTKEISTEKKKKIEDRKQARVSAKLEKIRAKRKENKRKKAIKQGKIF